MAATKSETASTTTWKEAYGILQKNAQTLRNQQEPDLDNLLTLVTQSMEAYKVCQARIVAVESALEQALGLADGEGNSVDGDVRADFQEPPVFMDVPDQ